MKTLKTLVAGAALVVGVVGLVTAVVSATSFGAVAGAVGFGCVLVAGGLLSN